MSIKKMIFYTSEADSQQFCCVGYQYDEGFKNLKIHSYGLFSVANPKYPSLDKDMKFKDTYIDSEGTLVSATAFIGNEAVFTAATEKNVGGKSNFGYINTNGEFITVGPCKVEVK